MYRGKFESQNRLGLYNTGRKIYISKLIGLAYNWKEIYATQKFAESFNETRLEDIDLTKTQPCKYIVYMEQGNPSQG